MGIKLERVDESHYKLYEDFTVSLSDKKITVKNGLITDGASIPKFLWWLIGSPFTGKYTKAAIVHDALYASHLVEREEADKIFNELMEQYEVAAWRRYLMYLAVRFFGEEAWFNTTLKGVQDAKNYIAIDSKYSY